jgi:hypothetical protein
VDRNQLAPLLLIAEQEAQAWQWPEGPTVLWGELTEEQKEWYRLQADNLLLTLSITLIPVPEPVSSGTYTWDNGDGRTVKQVMMGGWGFPMSMEEVDRIAFKWIPDVP